MNLECIQRSPQARIVVFSGDSIFFGSGVGREEVFTRLIQERLDREDGPGKWCIVNLSQPAYSFEQKMYWIDRLMESGVPAHLYLEVWPNDAGRFRLFGRHAYNFAGTDGDTDRLPGFVPEARGVTGWLFQHSRLFEYAVLAYPGDNPYSRSWLHTVWEPQVDRIDAALRERGGGMTLVVATRLDVPFAEVDRRRNDPQTPMIEYQERTGRDVVFLNRVLAAGGADFKDVRHDPCCHFNAKGHVILADAFLRLLRADVATESAEVRKADK
jgi:hypothetical protein